jgi:ATP-dependent DNA helicase RecG
MVKHQFTPRPPISGHPCAGFFIRIFNDLSEVESPTVTLLNLKRPSAWDEVSDWLDRHGSIANTDVVRIAKTDTLKASKLLAAWREQGLLVPLPGRGKRNMAYAKPTQGVDNGSLLSALEENNASDPI